MPTAARPLARPDLGHATSSRAGLGRAVLAEALGSALLAATVVGSGIAAQRLSPHDIGLQLLENAVVTGAVLVALITALRPVSAAFNPAVTLAERLLGAIGTRTALALVAAQAVGCCAGAVLANAMFDLPLVTLSTHHRSGGHLLLAEVVATFGLLLVVFGAVRSEHGHRVATAVGGYITGAYFFTSSTSFANPAITLGRTLSDTFAGIAPGSVLPFVGAQLVGAGLAVAVVRALYPDDAIVADDIAQLAGSAPDDETRPS